MFKTLDDIGDVRGKRVLVRADLNVPMDAGRVTDDSRLRAAMPTIAELSDKGARVVVLSHFGRPERGPDPSLSLRPVADALAAVLGRPVTFVGDVDSAARQHRRAARGRHRGGRKHPLP